MTFPSILISGKNSVAVFQQVSSIVQDLGQSITPNNPDILQIDDYSIATIRTLQTFLSKKPYSHNTKIIIIPDCHRLQTEAQNALLKILEEPGEGNHLILTTPYKNQVLPTILSRCYQINLAPSKIMSETKIFTPKSTTKDNLSFADTFPTTRAEALVFLETQINLFHQKLIDNPTPAIAKTLHRLQKSLNLVNSNVDPRSAYDYFLLS